MMQSDRVLKVHFVNNACEDGRLDTQRLKLLSEDAGFSCTNDVRRADLIFFYACGHLIQLESDAIRIIERIKRLKKPSAKLIVWGCLPKIDPESLRKVYDGPLVGPEEWNFFSDLLNQPRGRINHVFGNALYPHAKYPSPQRRIKAFMIRRLYSHIGWKWYIKIVSGCRNCCTYCSDRLAYRWTRSVPVDTILKQFELGLAANCKHF
jgi:ribosomal protein S12 methylthiotransferase